MKHAHFALLFFLVDLVIWLMEVFAVTLGQAIGALSPSMFVAIQTNAPIAVMLNIFCGVTVPQPAIPKFWRQCTRRRLGVMNPERVSNIFFLVCVGMYNLDPYTRLIAGLVVNELHDLRITCKSNEL